MLVLEGDSETQLYKWLWFLFLAIKKHML